MSAWELPTSLQVGGVDLQIRTDFRVILDILSYFNDPEYEPDEQWAICLDILYGDWESIPPEHQQEAMERAIWFINRGKKYDDKQRSFPKLMDWEQDAPMIASAINNATGKEIRELEYMHWWTFLDAYMGIGECLFSQVLSIRQKLQKGGVNKLEKWEKEFYCGNRDIVDLKHKENAEEAAERAAVDALFG